MASRDSRQFWESQVCLPLDTARHLAPLPWAFVKVCFCDCLSPYMRGTCGPKVNESTIPICPASASFQEMRLGDREPVTFKPHSLLTTTQ